MLLQSILLLPIVGSLILLILPETSRNQLRFIKQFGLFISVVTFILSIVLFILFDNNSTEYQFVSEFSQLSYCHFNIGVDGLSIYYILLTTFITPVALISNYNNIINKSNKLFIVAFLLLESLQLALFVVLDLFLFYIFFESVLPILFIIILIYGSGQLKERSALLFFLYTLAGSLFMLLAILNIYNHIGSTDFTIIKLTDISLDHQKVLFCAFFLAFAVKTPLFPVHIWLPKAHSDAPLAASILLAGTILKFATYGYLRILINFLPDACNYFSPIIQTIAIITLVYASLTTIVQEDTKELIAYSSICHMAVVTIAIFANNIQAIEGAILLSLAHGIVSPALFICVGGVLYDRYHTRNIHYFRGLVLTMPVFTILFFLAIIANTAVPLTLNYLGEQLALIGLFIMNPFAAIISASGILFSACYSIWLYNRISYGKFSPYIAVTNDVSRREFYVLFTLLFTAIILGIIPNVILDSLHATVTNLLYTV